MRLPFRRDADDDHADPSGEMTLVGHLTELRKRLIRSLISLFIGAVVVFVFRERIYDVLQGPYCDFQLENGREECQFLLRGPLEPFRVMLTLSGYGGLILATPVILYQLGRFVLPGLYPHEKKALLPFLAVSILLLAGGMAVAFFLMPKALTVLFEFGVDTFEPLFSPDEYLGFFVKMLFAFGLAAELPLVLVFLQKVGVVSNETLRKNRRIAVVAVVVLGAIITPTGDPFILGVISIPMYIFYELAILIGRRIKATPQAKAEVGV